jgi:sulfur-oxidizing protein SoxZ
MEVKPVKIRGRLKGDTADIKCLMPHPMETGVRKDLDGNLIPAHYIETVTCTHNGKVFMTADWGPSVSKDPYFGFTVAGAKDGDVIEVSWTDNLGNSSSGDLTLEGR